MKRRLHFLILLSLLFAACVPSLEKEGDKLNQKAEASTDVASKNLLQKAAWRKYQQAVAQVDGEVPTELKNKYVSSCVDRINNLKKSGGIEREELKAVRKTIDSYIRDKDITPEVGDKYATFLLELADTLKAATRLSECFETLAFAADIAGNKALVTAKKDEVKGAYIKDKLELANSTLTEALKEKDVNDEEVLKADYYARLVLHHDSTNAEAKALVSKTTKALLKYYRAYQRVFADPEEFGLDKKIFEKINDQQIVMALPIVEKRKGKLEIQGQIFSEANNAVRMRPELFELTLSNGKKLKAKKGKFNREILDTDREVEFDLTFNGVNAKPQILTYSSFDGKYTSVKRFY